MMKKIVNAAASFAVVVLENLAERIDRAGRQVAIAQMKSKKKAQGPAGVNLKAQVNKELYRTSNKADSSNAVLAKLNQTLAKDIQHHIPTARHS